MRLSIARFVVVEMPRTHGDVFLFHTVTAILKRITQRVMKKLFRNFSIAVAVIIIIWRGIWYLLDSADNLLFNGGHLVTSIGGIIAGILILYLPDRNLDELGKL